MIHASLALARRALRVTARRPQFIAPLLVFPSLLLAVNSGGLSQARNLPGFPPVQSFFDFQLAAAMSQSLLLGGVATGIAVALEIELGFFDRLVTAPIPRLSIVMGRLLAAAAIALFQLSWFAGIGLTLALRAGNASSVQAIFPLVFVVLFLSSAFFPENLLSWPANIIAQYNPLSYIANGMRAPIIGYGGAEAVLEGFGAALGMAVLFAGLATHALHRRLRAG
ncbi:MAG: ABC transporter permease [Solirubrobacterales bacterium]|nr:ABC transporter permease [Solirubrobacterales bacterium]